MRQNENNKKMNHYWEDNNKMGERRISSRIIISLSTVTNRSRTNACRDISRELELNPEIFQRDTTYYTAINYLTN